MYRLMKTISYSRHEIDYDEPWRSVLRTYSMLAFHAPGPSPGPLSKGLLIVRAGSVNGTPVPRHLDQSQRAPGMGSNFDCAIALNALPFRICAVPAIWSVEAKGRCATGQRAIARTVPPTPSFTSSTGRSTCTASTTVPPQPICRPNLTATPIGLSHPGTLPV